MRSPPAAHTVVATGGHLRTLIALTLIASLSGCASTNPKPDSTTALAMGGATAIVVAAIATQAIKAAVEQVETPIPGHDGSHMVRSPFPAAAVGAQIDHFIAAWVRIHPEDQAKITEVSDRLQITWTPGDHFAVGQHADGTPINSAGAVWSKGEVRGAPAQIQLARDYPSVSDSSLVHQLAHLFCWVTTGDPDEDHLGPGSGCWDAKVDRIVWETRYPEIPYSQPRGGA